MSPFARWLFLGAALEVAACAAPESAETADQHVTGAADAEARAAARLESLRGDPAGLETFLRAMPKGGDLHNHLSGGIYAESFIAWAKADGLCVNASSLALVPASQCGTSGVLGLPSSPADPLYAKLVEAWSMESFTPSSHESGHDHFFATFSKYGLVSGGHTGDMLAEAASRAANDHELYLELMFGIGVYPTAQVADGLWGSGHTLGASDLDAFYDRLVTNPSWENVLGAGSSALDAAEAKTRAVLQCDTGAPQPGCGVTLRYLHQTSRVSPPHQVFAQLVAAFELAIRDHRVVGMNLVAPEDNPVALRDYELHMTMLDFLHRKYAGRSPLRIALHAGELTPGVLPASQQSSLKFHIRRAVEVGHAERIGHGVDILDETDSADLRAELHDKNVLVEICLTSNAEILLVSGTKHPLASYLADHVPVALATDDPGVARSSLSKEYLRAATDQALGYADLKRMTRQSLEHSFLPGASLWASVEDGHKVEACAAAGDACTALLASSERARMQWTLEERLAAFEQASP